MQKASSEATCHLYGTSHKMDQDAVADLKPDAIELEQKNFYAGRCSPSAYLSSAEIAARLKSCGLFHARSGMQ